MSHVVRPVSKSNLVGRLPIRWFNLFNHLTYICLTSLNISPSLFPSVQTLFSSASNLFKHCSRPRQSCHIITVIDTCMHVDFHSNACNNLSNLRFHFQSSTYSLSQWFKYISCFCGTMPKSLFELFKYLSGLCQTLPNIWQPRFYTCPIWFEPVSLSLATFSNTCRILQQIFVVPFPNSLDLSSHRFKPFPRFVRPSRKKNRPCHRVF